MQTTASLANHFLIAMPGMDDPNFSRGVTLLCHHSDEGAMGLMLNRNSDLVLGELMTRIGIQNVDASVASHAVLSGGPVEPERGFVLHSPDAGQYDATYRVSDQILLTTSRDVLEAMARGEGPKRALIALGYAGALQYFQPVQPLLAIGSVVLLAVALVMRIRRERSCPLPQR